jgi:predicted metal-dependent hydrolase
VPAPSQLALGFAEAPAPLDPAPPEPVPLDPAPPVIEIRPSTRRRKTVGAHWEGETIVVVVPHRLSKRVQREYADDLAARLLDDRRATHPGDDALMQRAIDLLGRHLPEVAPPAAVRWATRDSGRWGSCSLTHRTIELSRTLRGVPPWVLDAVLLHELAHLLHPRHDAAFRQVVARYERAADAEVFLAGYQLGLERAGP